MKFRLILLSLVLSLIISSPVWGQPPGWALFVPTGAQYTGSGGASFYSYYVNHNFFCSLWNLTGIDGFVWECCCGGDPGHLEPHVAPYQYFDFYQIHGDYYDCDGNLLEGDAATSGGWGVVKGTGDVFGGGIGGLGTYDLCILTSMSDAVPAQACRVFYDMTPIKNGTCNPWPAIVVDDNKNKGKRCVNTTKGGINAGTGNNYQDSVDIGNSSPGGIPVELAMSYNSKSPTDGPFGYGWTHNYDLSLEVVQTQPQTRLRIWDSDGKALYFTQVRQTTSEEIPFTGESGVKDRLKQIISTGEYLLRRKDSNLTYKFASDGKLTQIFDTNGNTLTMTYTGNLLTQVSNNFGKALSIQYNGDNRISSVTDPKGQTVLYGYTNGDLTSVTYPDTNSVSYAYSAHQLTDKYDTNNNLIGHWGYDSKGMATSYYSYLKNGVPQDQITLEYEHQLTKVTDSVGTTNYTIQNVQGIYIVKESEGCSSCGSQHKRFTYDQRLNLVSVTSVGDTGDVTTQYVYDDPVIPWEQLGDVLQKTEAAGLSEQRVTNYSYTHDTNDPILVRQRVETKASVVASNQNRASTTNYDASGNLTSRVETGYVLVNEVPTQRTYTTSYQYNSYGQLTQIDGPRTDVSDITTQEYYPNTSDQGNNRGQLKAIVNALNQRTEFSNYDANGNVGTITDPNGIVTQRTYDQRNRLLTSTNLSTNAQTQYSYDARGNLYIVILPEGNTITSTYDLANRLTDITDSLGNHIHYEYDVEGNRTHEETKDPQGTLKKYLDFTYDAYNRLKRIVNPDTNYTEYTYDALGNRTNVKDPKNNNTVYAYDNLRRVVTMTQPIQTITHYGYDTHDNLTIVTDPKGNTTQYQYDDFGRRIKVISPDTGTTIYSHDEAGNISQKIDARGTVVNYTYDVLNRITAAQFTDQTQNITYSYDSTSVTNGKSRLTGRVDSSGSYAFWYDAQGNLSREDKTISNVLYTTQYAYNLDNNLTSTIYPTGRTVTYTLDQTGRITQVDTTLNGNPKTLASSISYLPYGWITELTFGNGLSLSHGYDNQYRTSSIVVGSVMSRTYDYDPNGNITSILDAVEPPGNETFENAGTYAYDTGTNILAETQGEANVVYDYDENGNTISANNRTFIYDLSNRLITVQDSGVTIAQYVYNALNQRIKKILPSETRIFHYDLQGHLIAETDSNGVMLAEYFYLGDQSLAMIRPAEAVYYFHNDHLETPQILTDDSQNVAWKAFYKPFGEAITSVQNVENLFRYPGQYFDQETGFHYNWNRYYDPKTGRYLTPDPIGLKGGFDLFVYAMNNPLISIDPSGLDCTSDEDCLKCMVYAEARGNNSICLKAVAWTIKNRVRGPLNFRNQTTICAVCKAKVPGSNRYEYDAYDKANWKDCCDNTCIDDPGKKKDLEAVKEALNPLGPDITNGAQFFRSDGRTFANTPYATFEEKKVPGCDDFRFFRAVPKEQGGN